MATKVKVYKCDSCGELITNRQTILVRMDLYIDDEYGKEKLIRHSSYSESDEYAFCLPICLASFVNAKVIEHNKKLEQKAEMLVPVETNPPAIDNP